MFRLEGGPGLPEAIGRTHPITILTTVAAARTVCLVAVPVQALADFRREVLRLAESGTVTRLEAEPKTIMVSTHAEDDFGELILARPVVGFLSKAALSARAIGTVLSRGRAPARPGVASGPQET